MNRHCIYIIKNIQNGKRYVGQTVDLAKRKASHFCATACGIVGRAIKKYGRSAFEFRPIAVGMTKSEANDAERYLIKHLRTLVPNGYNIALGGDGCLGWSPSLAMRLKMSARIAASCARPDVIRHRSAGQLARFSDPDERQRQIIRAKRACDSRGPQTEETRHKIAASMKTIWRNPDQRKKRLAGWQTPEVIARRNEAIRIAWADQERRRAQSARTAASLKETVSL